MYLSCVCVSVCVVLCLLWLFKNIYFFLFSDWFHQFSKFGIFVKTFYLFVFRQFILSIWVTRVSFLFYVVNIKWENLNAWLLVYAIFWSIDMNELPTTNISFCMSNHINLICKIYSDLFIGKCRRSFKIVFNLIWMLLKRRKIKKVNTVTNNNK